MTEVVEPVRLNLGAGDKPLEGFVDLDRKSGQEAYPLDYAEESVDEIRASHVLEHFPYGKVIEVLKHWVSRLKPGGLLRVAVPNFQWIAKHYLDGEPIHVQGYTMGGQTDENDFHQAIFDRELLTEAMINVNLERIGPWVSEIEDCARLPVSLNLQGFKPTSAHPVTEKVCAILSCPRFGPTLHMRCTFNALGRARIPYSVMQGAYWHAVLSEVMETALTKDHIDFIITLDYDTVFDYQDVLELWRLIRAHDGADAVCALQSKRGGKNVLVGMTDADNMPRTRVYKAEFQQSLTQIQRGHFGLTIFRAESLRTQARPWMVPTPGTDGRWTQESGKVDADIDFWRRWREAGKTLYLANHVVVGHLEEVVSWPGLDLKPVYQGASDYADHGIPADVTRVRNFPTEEEQ